MFASSPRLTAGEVETKLRPIVRDRYAANQTALRAAERILDGFKDWIDASHNYRHEPGVQEPAQPPPDLAIFAISNGASFLRWLVDIDQDSLG